MSSSIYLSIDPPVPGLGRARTDGKNLCEAFVSAAIGGVDMMALMQHPDMELPEGLGETGGPSPFDPLDPFIDKEAGFRGETPARHFAPAEGLAAIEQVSTALHGPEGERAVPNPDTRRGALYDLEMYAQHLRAAEQAGASFAFYMA